MRRIANELDTAAAPILRQGRVNKPHFEHYVTRLRSFSSRGWIWKARAHLVGVTAVDQPSSTHFSVSSLRDDVQGFAADVIRQ
jgi:hypothetical protein